MIMAVTTEERKNALDLLLPYQRADFEGIFRAMDGMLIKRALVLVKHCSEHSFCAVPFLRSAGHNQTP